MVRFYRGQDYYNLGFSRSLEELQFGLGFDAGRWLEVRDPGTRSASGSPQPLSASPAGLTFATNKPFCYQSNQVTPWPQRH